MSLVETQTVEIYLTMPVRLCYTTALFSLAACTCLLLKGTLVCMLQMPDRFLHPNAQLIRAHFVGPSRDVQLSDQVHETLWLDFHVTGGRTPGRLLSGARYPLGQPGVLYASGPL